MTGAKPSVPTVNLVLALACEAKPLIDYYRLGKDHSTKLPLFRSQASDQRAFNINLVVAGIGVLNMAMACGWLAARSDNRQSVWLNVGTAGHAQLPVGELVLVVCSQDATSDTVHYPPLVAKWTGANVSLLTGNGPIVDYPVNQAVDMEASAFYQVAKRFTTTELAQSLKIISDNQEQGISLLSAPRISELVAAQIEQIADFVNALALLVPPQLQQPALLPGIENLYCTTSQLHQYRDLMNKISNIGIADQVISKNLIGADSMAKVLAELRRLQQQSAPNIT